MFLGAGLEPARNQVNALTNEISGNLITFKACPHIFPNKKQYVKLAKTTEVNKNRLTYYIL